MAYVYYLFAVDDFRELLKVKVNVRALHIDRAVWRLSVLWL